MMVARVPHRPALLAELPRRAPLKLEAEAPPDKAPRSDAKEELMVSLRAESWTKAFDGSELSPKGVEGKEDTVVTGGTMLFLTLLLRVRGTWGLKASIECCQFQQGRPKYVKQLVSLQKYWPGTW